MAAQLGMVFRQGGRCWLGKLADHPEIMNQGEAIEVLEADLRDACREMLLGVRPRLPGEGHGL